jgi:hypothetical protein
MSKPGLRRIKKSLFGLSGFNRASERSAAAKAIGRANRFGKISTRDLTQASRSLSRNTKDSVSRFEARSLKNFKLKKSF